MIRFCGGARVIRSLGRGATDSKFDRRLLDPLGRKRGRGSRFRREAATGAKNGAADEPERNDQRNPESGDRHRSGGPDPASD
jgi:hypothetical protein